MSIGLGGFRYEAVIAQFYNERFITFEPVYKSDVLFQQRRYLCTRGTRSLAR